MTTVTVTISIFLISALIAVSNGSSGYDGNVCDDNDWLDLLNDILDHCYQSAVSTGSLNTNEQVNIIVTNLNDDATDPSGVLLDTLNSIYPSNNVGTVEFDDSSDLPSDSSDYIGLYNTFAVISVRGMRDESSDDQQTAVIDFVGNNGGCFIEIYEESMVREFGADWEISKSDLDCVSTKNACGVACTNSPFATSDDYELPCNDGGDYRALEVTSSNEGIYSCNDASEDVTVAQGSYGNGNYYFLGKLEWQCQDSVDVNPAACCSCTGYMGGSLTCNDECYSVLSDLLYVDDPACATDDDYDQLCAAEAYCTCLAAQNGVVDYTICNIESWVDLNTPDPDATNQPTPEPTEEPMISLTSTLDVQQINDAGFGDRTNQYAFAMAEFKGSIYVGTLNGVNGAQSILLFFLGQPFETTGTQIWKGTLNTSNNEFSWAEVVSAGNGNPLNYGVRKFLVVGDYLYAVTANHVSGFELWRTNDGSNWDIIISGGYGDSDNTSGRGLTVFNGYLYIGVENRATGAKMLVRTIDESTGEFLDPTTNSSGVWTFVTDNGFGYPFNFWFSDFAAFNGRLYVGTLNLGGMQLYYSENGFDFSSVFIRGNGERFNSAVMDLYVFKDRLYVGSMNFIEGSTLWVSKQGTDGSDPEDFETIFIGGNGNAANNYVWSMIEYNERLYVGTFDSSGQFDLFSSEMNNPNGGEWTIETRDAFDVDSVQYGIRSMIVFEDRLILGGATADYDDACRVFAATSV